MDCVRVQDTELNDPMWVSNAKNFLNLWGQMRSFCRSYSCCIALGPSPPPGGGAVADDSD